MNSWWCAYPFFLMTILVYLFVQDWLNLEAQKEDERRERDGQGPLPWY